MLESVAGALGIDNVSGSGDTATVVAPGVGEGVTVAGTVDIGTLDAVSTGGGSSERPVVARVGDGLGTDVACRREDVPRDALVLANRGVGVAGRTGISSESPVVPTTIVFTPVDLDAGMTIMVLVNIDAPPGSADDTKVRSLVAGFVDVVTFAAVIVVPNDAAGSTTADLTCSRNKVVNQVSLKKRD